jgi:hypothetical protein
MVGFLACDFKAIQVGDFDVFINNILLRGSWEGAPDFLRAFQVALNNKRTIFIEP